MSQKIFSHRYITLFSKPNICHINAKISSAKSKYMHCSLSGPSLFSLRMTFGIYDGKVWLAKQSLEYTLSKNIKDYRRHFIFHLIYLKVCLLYENILLQISFWEFSTKRNKSVHSDVSPGNRMQFERTSEVQKKSRTSESLICVRSSHSEILS